jgi:hypothetical protein
MNVNHAKQSKRQLGVKSGRMKMRVLYVELPTWRWNGYVVTGCSYQEFAQWANKNFGVGLDPEKGEHIRGTSVTVAPFPWFIWLTNLKTVPELAHEVFHAAFTICVRRGIVPSEDSEEAIAYTITEILDKIYDKKAKWRKR